MNESRRLRPTCGASGGPTQCQECKSSYNEFPRLLTIVPINIDQNEPMDTKKKEIYQ